MKSQGLEDLTIPPDGRPESSQPRWRRDFPIDWPQDEYISRRDFTRFLVLTSLAFTVGQFWILLQNYWRKASGELPIQEIVALDELPVGGWLVFTYPDEHNDCVLVRLAEESFVAYDQQCTHLLCPVIPQPESGGLHCPCHEGLFDLQSGRPLAGPPSRPLPRITLEIRNNRVYATGREVAA
jgi:nitrite reductase/ring-hydroxylating ferredoxin subunit